MRKAKTALTTDGIYACVTGKDYAEIEREFDGKGYGDFKTAVGEAVAAHLRPIQEEFARLSADKAYIEACYTEGAQRHLPSPGAHSAR